mmetsp:Transcript_20307/g.68954  ORF Transcript_20307/g.68954 Transcript_20307/m.68954 type:complete len:369 (+) Transcript_20307:522-1628(+)
MTLESRSGTEVPAASNVSPRTTVGMLSVTPTTAVHSTIQKEKNPIQQMETRKAAGAQRVVPGLRTSTTVSQSTNIMGKTNKNQNLAPALLSCGKDRLMPSISSSSSSISSCLSFQKSESVYHVSNSWSVMVLRCVELVICFTAVTMSISVELGLSWRRTCLISFTSSWPSLFSSIALNVLRSSVMMRFSDLRYHSVNSSKLMVWLRSLSTSSMTCCTAESTSPTLSSRSSSAISSRDNWPSPSTSSFLNVCSMLPEILDTTATAARFVGCPSRVSMRRTPARKVEGLIKLSLALRCCAAMADRLTGSFLPEVVSFLSDISRQLGSALPSGCSVGISDWLEEKRFPTIRGTTFRKTQSLSSILYFMTPM